MIKSLISGMVSRYSPSLFFSLSYFHNRRRLLHLRHPRDISEIWIRKLLDDEFCKIAYLAHKYAVRSCVNRGNCVGVETGLLSHVMEFG